MWDMLLQSLTFFKIKVMVSLCPVLMCLSFSVAGPVLETTVGEHMNSKMLLNLQSGTEYSVQVTASYPTGQSEPLLVNAKTCKHHTLLDEEVLNAGYDI